MVFFGILSEDERGEKETRMEAEGSHNKGHHTVASSPGCLRGPERHRNKDENAKTKILSGFPDRLHIIIDHE